MATREERMKILEMVSNGTISLDEADRLLEALGNTDTVSAETRPVGRNPKWLKVRVTDTASNRPRVNISIPVMLVKAALKLGGKISFAGLKESNIGLEGVKTLEEAISSGEIGKIVDVYDEEDEKHVEVYLE